MGELSLGVSEVLSGVNNILIKSWCTVVHSLQCWVHWWLLEFKVPVVSNDTFGNLKVISVVDNFVVDTEAWDWVVNWIWELLVSVEILGASGRVADWIRLNLDIGFKLDIIGVEDQFVGELNLSILEVGSSINNFTIELWTIVI